LSGLEVEVEGELPIAAVLCPNALHGLAGSAPHAMSLMPTLHPDVAALRFPDLGQLHDAPTARAFERIVAKALFDALAPLEVLEGLGQRLQVEERDLETERIQGRVDERDEFAFNVASVETGVADYLHSLRWNVGDETRDEVEGGAVTVAR
jgi:hypothetical protein